MTARIHPLLGALILLGSVGGTTGCGHFRCNAKAYQATKTIAIVESMGVVGEAAAPLDVASLTGPSAWDRIVANDTVTLSGFFEKLGFKVLAIDEMVASEKYYNNGQYVPNEYFSPKGMRRFAPVGHGVELSFMTANRLAKDLGVDAVACVHQKWDKDSIKFGLEEVAKTTVAIAMVDRRSNNLWSDIDSASSTATIATAAGLKSVEPTEFVAAYNEAFELALAKMHDKLKVALQD